MPFSGPINEIIADLEESTSEELVAAISNELARVNETLPMYDLLLSIVIVHWDPGTEHKCVIKVADDKMYRVKRNRKSMRDAYIDF